MSAFAGPSRVHLWKLLSGRLTTAQRPAPPLSGEAHAWSIAVPRHPFGASAALMVSDGKSTERVRNSQHPSGRSCGGLCGRRCRNGHRGLHLARSGTMEATKWTLSGGSWAMTVLPHAASTTGSRVLGVLGGDWSVARDIDSARAVVGTSSSANGDGTPFIWSESLGMSALPVRYGGNAFAMSDVRADGRRCRQPVRLGASVGGPRPLAVRRTISPRQPSTREADGGLSCHCSYHSLKSIGQ
jgi:hypothetical protein